MSNLDFIKKDRTTFIIAHRLSTVRRCDVIIVLDKGKIVEADTHQKLMENQKYYYYLNMQQEATGVQKIV